MCMAVGCRKRPITRYRNQFRVMLSYRCGEGAAKKASRQAVAARSAKRLSRQQPWVNGRYRMGFATLSLRPLFVPGAALLEYLDSGVDRFANVVADVFDVGDVVGAIEVRRVDRLGEKDVGAFAAGYRGRVLTDADRG